MKLNKNSNYIAEIKQILSQARQKAYSAVNSAMVEAYWLTGKRIVEEEQGGEKRAEYGKYVIRTLAKELTAEFGKGFDAREIRRIRQFYLTFPIRDAVSPESDKNPLVPAKKLEKLSIDYVFTRLSWTHIRYLLRVSDSSARNWYIKEAVENNWSTRTLDRNISTQYYHRLLASRCL